jgi:hypothetical protein
VFTVQRLKTRRGKKAAYGKKYRRRMAQQILEMRQSRIGAHGAASAVRSVDPASIDLPTAKVVVERPQTKEFKDTGKQLALERKADRLLQRTGKKSDAMLTRKDLSDQPRSADEVA